MCLCVGMCKMSGSAHRGQKIFVSPTDEVIGCGESQGRDAVNQNWDLCKTSMHFNHQPISQVPFK